MQALTDTQIKEMKSELRRRLEKVIMKYFEERNENVLVKDLERFINTTIRYESMKHNNSCFTVRISAKADDAIEIVHNDAISSKFTGMCAATGCLLGSVGGPIGIVTGAALGTAVGTAVETVVE